MLVGTGRKPAQQRFNSRIAWVAAVGAVGLILALPEVAEAQSPPPGGMQRGPSAAQPGPPRERFDIFDLLDRDVEKSTAEKRALGVGPAAAPMTETDVITCVAGCDGDRGKVVYRAAAPKPVNTLAVLQALAQPKTSSSLVPTSLTPPSGSGAAASSLTTSAFECIAGCDQPTLPRRMIALNPPKPSSNLASAEPVRERPSVAVAAKPYRKPRHGTVVVANVSAPQAKTVVVDVAAPKAPEAPLAAPAIVVKAPVAVVAAVTPPPVEAPAAFAPAAVVPAPVAMAPVAAASIAPASVVADAAPPPSDSNVEAPAIPVTKVALVPPAAPRLKQSLATDDMPRAQRRLARKAPSRSVIAKAKVPAADAPAALAPPVVATIAATQKPASPLANTPTPPKLAATTPEPKAPRRPVPKAVTVSTDWFNKANRDRQEQAKASGEPAN